MADPIFSQGTTLQYSTDSGSTYTPLAHVKDFPFPDSQRDLIEVTDHDSPGHREEFVLGLTRSGEVQFKVSYIPTDPTHDAATGFLALLAAGVAVDWQIVCVDEATTTWSFAGLPRRFMPSAPVNGVYEADVSIKPTGAVSIA